MQQDLRQLARAILALFVRAIPVTFATNRSICLSKYLGRRFRPVDIHPYQLQHNRA